MSNYARAEMPAVYSYTEFTNYEFLIAKAIPHHSKCRYGERGAAAAHSYLLTPTRVPPNRGFGPRLCASQPAAFRVPELPCWE